MLQVDLTEDQRDLIVEALSIKKAFINSGVSSMDSMKNERRMSELTGEKDLILNTISLMQDADAI